MSPRVPGAGVELAYEEHGEGADAVLVHGVAGGMRTWDEVLSALGGRVRALPYDRRGYGGSEAPEPYTGTTVEEQTEDLAHLIGALAGGPVVLCAHSFGCAIATDLMLRHPGLVRAAVLLDPSLLSLTPLGPEAAGEMREAVMEGAGAGGGAGAVDALLRHYGGERIFDALGSERLAAARAAAVPFAADLAAASHWGFTHGDLRSLEMPVIVIRGRRSLRAWREAAESLADHLPAGELREADSDHFIFLDDPGAVADAIVELAASS